MSHWEVVFFFRLEIQIANCAVVTLPGMQREESKTYLSQKSHVNVRIHQWTVDVKAAGEIQRANFQYSSSNADKN